MTPDSMDSEETGAGGVRPARHPRRRRPHPHPDGNETRGTPPPPAPPVPPPRNPSLGSRLRSLSDSDLAGSRPPRPRPSRGPLDRPGLQRAMRDLDRREGRRTDDFRGRDISRIYERIVNSFTAKESR